MITLKLYSRKTCSQCMATKRHLESNSIAFEYIDIDENAEAYNHVTNLGVKALPYIEYGDQSWTGFRPDSTGRENINSHSAKSA